MLNKGEIVEQGSHRYLISKGGYYAQMWAHQSDSEILDDSMQAVD